MCNCGSKRAHLTQQHSTTSGIISPGEEIASDNRRSIRFEYIGNTALTVTGSITGRRYRFNRPGETVHVDLSDVSGLMLIPVLRKALDA